MPMLSFRTSDERKALIDAAAPVVNGKPNRSAFINGLIDAHFSALPGSESENAPVQSARAAVDRRTELLRRARI